MSIQNLAGSEPIGLAAAVAITRRRFVKVTAAMTVSPTAAGTDMGIGVAMEGQATVGANVPIQLFGIAQVEAGAAIAVGAQVTSDASARAVTVATGNTTYGLALSAAAAAGETVMVLLATPNVNGPVNP